VRVFDRGFVHHMVRTEGSVPLNDMESIGMVITSPIEPRLLTLSGNVNYQRVAFPSAARPTHPRICRSFLRRIHTNRASRACELICHQNVRTRPLDDL